MSSLEPGEGADQDEDRPGNFARFSRSALRWLESACAGQREFLRAVEAAAKVLGLEITTLNSTAAEIEGGIEAVSARLPVEKRAGFVQRVAAALAAGETSLLNAIAVAQRSGLSAPPVAS